MVEISYVKINELLNDNSISTITPTFKLKNEDVYDSGANPVVSQDQQFVIGYTDLKDDKLANAPYIIFGDHTEIIKYIDFPFVQGADGIKILKVNSNSINPRYLYYALKSCYYPTGFYERHFKLLKKTYIPNYTYDYQKKIAKILSDYDDLIGNNNNRIKFLENMAEELYKEWFVRFEFPGNINTKFINGMPIDWSIKELKEFGITLTSGSRPKGGIDNSLKEGVPSFGAEVIGELGQFNYSEVKYIQKDFYDKMKRGKNTKCDILLYKDGAYIGKITMFRDGYPFDKYCINEHVFFIEPYDMEYKNYLYFTLHQKEIFNLMQILNRNAAQPGLSQDDVARIKIKIPSKSIIKKFNIIVDEMLQLIFKYAKENYILSKQRDYLLPRLMSGKLSVENKNIV